MRFGGHDDDDDDDDDMGIEFWGAGARKGAGKSKVVRE